MLKRKQRTGLLKVYKFRSVADIDAYLVELRHSVHTVEYAQGNLKNDLDLLLDARLALMREADKHAQ